MKAAVMMAAAMCAVGGPQAATWSWTGQKTGGGALTSAGGLPPVTAFDGITGGVMTYAAKITFTELPFSDSMVIFRLSNSNNGGATDNSDNNGVQRSINGSGQLVYSVSNTNSSSWGGAGAANERTTGTITAGIIADSTLALAIAVNNSGNAENGLKAGGFTICFDGGQGGQWAKRWIALPQGKR